MSDRTNDFLRLCEKEKRNASVVHTTVVNRKPTPAETAQFSAAASDVSKEVNITSEKLQQLTRLVRQNDMFNDPSAQINELAASIKGDIANINMQLDNLQTYVDSNKSISTSKQSVNHTNVIVSQMKSDLMETTKGFKDILQIRQENMKLQKDRKARYGNSVASTLGKPLTFRHRTNAGSSALPRPDGVVGEGGGSEAVPLIALQPQQQLIPAQNYVEARADAVTNIQSHIVELGQIFNRLAVMINEQGEMVQRIDDNVEDTLTNVNRGQNELVRYFNNLSDNKLLAMKVFGILLTFIIFFIFFLA